MARTVWLSNSSASTEAAWYLGVMSIPFRHVPERPFAVGPDFVGWREWSPETTLNKAEINVRRRGAVTFEGSSRIAVSTQAPERPARYLQDSVAPSRQG